MIVNSLYPSNQTVLVGTAALTASIALFIALVAETMTTNIVSAVVNKNLEDQTSLLSAVIGRTLYKVIKDEQKNESAKEPEKK
jgi:predicted lipoprotein with Yx(FWY)xxD motif